MYRKLVVECACGNSFETRSTSTSIHVEVCSQCHPYYTGKQRLLDTAGRVDRFRRKYKTKAAVAKAGFMAAPPRAALAGAAEVAREVSGPEVARDTARLQELGREH